MTQFKVTRWFGELGDYYEWKPNIEDGVAESGGELVHVIPGVTYNVIAHGTLDEVRSHIPEGLIEETEDRDIPEQDADTVPTSSDSESSD